MTFCENFEFIECFVTYWIWRTIIPFYLFIGTCGNIFNIVILVRPRMRKYTTSAYLFALAFSDTTFLWVASFPRVLEHINGWLINDMYPRVFCHTIPWLTYMSGGYSVWLLAAMSLERMLMTKYVTFAKTKLTVKNARICCCVILVVVSLLSVHYFFGVEIQQTAGCEWKLEYGEFYRETWPVIVLVVLNFIPMIIIIVSNIGILINVISQKRKLQKVNPITESKNAKSDDKLNAMTRMLFMISSFFVITTLPFTLFQIFWWQIDSSTQHALAIRQLLDAFFEVLIYANYSFNFFLYFISGSLFKQEWKLLVSEVANKVGLKTNKNATSVATVAR